MTERNQTDQPQSHQRIFTADEIRALRVRYLMSQRELAERIGVTIAAVASWEYERAVPTRFACFTICREFLIERCATPVGQHCERCEQLKH